ncbi:LacI family transcriptional regulator [Agromyces albus]|uniref:LacI family transcriptional regulator n=1 Tax=Agromyces albus TaxID=205332 RepID=A0A4Q2L9Q3_9MICO|nr:LacI family transcriptional regulator [Agromyces albus]
MTRMPTIQDVAGLAHVSKQTVSNVINSPSTVREATRSRVLAAIDELGYRPHASARRLRTRKSSTIGVRLAPLPPDGISSAILDRFVRKLTEQADARDLRVMLFTAGDPVEEIDRIRRLHEGSDADAFVLSATEYGDPRIAWLVEQDIPFVSFGRPWDAKTPHHRWVDVDGRAGVGEAVRHLRAHGAQRVGWIGWTETSGNGNERRSGWEAESGLSATDQRTYSRRAPDDVTEGTRCAMELLSLPEPPDALVCASDSLALGAMTAARMSGRPALPVIGFDDTPIAAAVGLSSVEQPLDEVAATALALLFGPEGDDVLPNPGDDEEPTNRLLAPRLVERRPSHLQLDATTGD